MPIKSQKTQLQTIVTLYRAFGKPSLIEKNSFSATAIASTEIIDAIKDCQALSPSCGRFDEVLVNGKEQRADQALKVGDEISIRWLLSTNGQIPFYRDYCHLLESRTSIYKGSAPDFYYVSDEDFINDEVSCSQTSQRLQKLCQVIECLSVIAQYHDEKSTSDTFRLVFIVPESETKPHQPIVLDTKFRMSDLAGPEIDISTIQEIATAISSEETHAQEKAGLFRLCLADIIESTPEACSSFSYLIQEWPTLLQKYKQSYETYISGFAFNRVRSELAKVEVEIASSLSKALNDITTKLLSIPISFAALLTMSKLESIEENVIFVIGTIIFSLIISGLVKNQLLLKENLDSSSKLIFEQFKKGKRNYPKELKECLESAEKAISKQSSLLSITLQSGRVVGWLVSFISVGIFASKF